MRKIKHQHQMTPPVAILRIENKVPQKKRVGLIMFTKSRCKRSDVIFPLYEKLKTEKTVVQ